MWHSGEVIFMPSWLEVCTRSCGLGGKELTNVIRIPGPFLSWLTMIVEYLHLQCLLLRHLGEISYRKAGRHSRNFRTATTYLSTTFRIVISAKRWRTLQIWATFQGLVNNTVLFKWWKELFANIIFSWRKASCPRNWVLAGEFCTNRSKKAVPTKLVMIRHLLENAGER